MWSWVGLPLFATPYDEVERPLYPHLMDLRSIASREWYFDRRQRIDPVYQADALARTGTWPTGSTSTSPGRAAPGRAASCATSTTRSRPRHEHRGLVPGRRAQLVVGERRAAHPRGDDQGGRQPARRPRTVRSSNPIPRRPRRLPARRGHPAARARRRLRRDRRVHRPAGTDLRVRRRSRTPSGWRRSRRTLIELLAGRSGPTRACGCSSRRASSTCPTSSCSFRAAADCRARVQRAADHLRRERADASSSSGSSTGAVGAAAHRAAP